MVDSFVQKSYRCHLFPLKKVFLGYPHSLGFSLPSSNQIDSGLLDEEQINSGRIGWR